MVVPGRVAQDESQMAERLARDLGAVGNLPVRHPGQFCGERIGQPRQVDPPLIAPPGLPAVEVRAENQAPPGRREILPEPLGLLEVLGRTEPARAFTAHRCTRQPPA
ncbi:hypothetical protein GCM10029978_115900 [Actinoallomurus acanthiterrae]